MQRLKSAASLFRCHISKFPAKTSLRSITNNPLKNDEENVVLIEGNAASRTAVLNRPSVLNAINTSMAANLQDLYKSWEDNPDIKFVVLKGRERAFCAGGDVVSLCRLSHAGSLEKCKEFFWTLYTYIYILGTYIKPHVALLNGVTMGGGAGISVPGTFRVATDKTVFSTPETIIGFHPDAGASFYLSHLPGHLGEYLALTGDKLTGAEMLACGLATHFSHTTKLSLIEQGLSCLMSDDPSVLESYLASYGDLVHPHQTSLIHRIDTINICFSHSTVEEIIDALESEGGRTQDQWCSSTLTKLKKLSPLSLKVSLRSIREGRYQSLDECLIREYRMSLQGVSGHITNDFREGVRALLVDKDLTPKWDPPSLEHVTTDMVDEYFSRLSAVEADLQLPTQSREAFT